MQGVTSLLGIIFALSAAATWGTGDFLGGFATRRNSAFLVLGIVSASGLAGVLLLGWLTGEALPAWVDVGWASAAGVLGGIGIITLYRGLALGAEAGAGAAMVSPIAAVVGAVVPVLVSSFQEGLPAALQLAGFAAGISGIWLVTRPHALDASSGTAHQQDGLRAGKRQGIQLAVAAGMGFGGFFVCLAQVSAGSLYYPLAASKLVEGGVAIFAILAVRLRHGNFQSEFILNGGRIALASAMGAGLLDAAGNVLYMLATGLTRLDVAAVLVSMYPVGTVLLAGMVMKERVGRWQWAGVLLCVVGVGLIAG
jgi:drug/metabolite transporter (DMT)-like permease